MTNYIKKLSGKQYLERIKNNPIVIIPTGACEIYGPHLPMGTDLIVAKKISEILSEKTDALIAPTIEIGESSALESFGCTFSIPRKILEDYIDELLKKFINDGLKKFLFITGHAGNVDTINYISKKNINKYDIKIAQVDWWRFTSFNGQGIFDYTGQMAHGHASECGTSVMLYLFPELVNMKELTKIDPQVNKYEDIIKIERFSNKTINGTIGDSKVASGLKGEKIVEKCINKILDFINDEFMEGV